MAYSNIDETDPVLDIEPAAVHVNTIKFRSIKNLPRWLQLKHRRMGYENYAQECKLLGDEPVSKHRQGHVSAAKLRGSPEYNQKIVKMAERRSRVRCHEADTFVTNVRWCGCSTDHTNQEQLSHCCWCAEYGAPDMKKIKENKWGSKYANVWTPPAKKRKTPPRDKPCAPGITTPASGWVFCDETNYGTPCEPLVFPHQKKVKPDIYSKYYIYNDYVNAFYNFYP